MRKNAELSRAIGQIRSAFLLDQSTLNTLMRAETITALPKWAQDFLRREGYREFVFAEPRQNPYHDPKSGKFTTGSGGAKLYGWQKGQWQLRTDVPEYLRVYQNGEHQVAIRGGTNLSRSQEDKLVADVDNLIEIDPPPHGPLRLRVATDAEFKRHNKADNVAGFAFVGTSEIVLRDSTVGQDAPLVDPTWHNVNVAQNVPARTYFLTHEWGHITDENNDATRKIAFQETGGGPSQYGKKNEYEAYAEAYAEWMLTKGKTGFLSAKQYAEYYNWPYFENPGPVTLADLAKMGRP